jgi:hypothetical protein
MKKRASSDRWFYSVIILAVVTLGLASREFPQLMPSVLGKYPGDMLWAMVVFFVAALPLRAWTTRGLSLLSIAVCGSAEVLKLMPSESLKSLRYTIAGHLLLGHEFMWQNLVAYAVGILCASFIHMTWQRGIAIERAIA